MNAVRDERGETLVELLITVLVVSIGLVAVVGAIASSIIVSDAHRIMAAGEVLVRDFSDAIKIAAAANGETGDDDYVECPAAGVLTPSAYSPPTGWETPVITQIEYWIPSSDPDEYPNGSFSDPDTGDPYTRDNCLDWYDDCGDDIPACDPGLQRISFTISNAREANPDDYGGTTASGTTVVRRGSAEVSP